MKKLLATMLALVCAVGMSMTVLAGEDGPVSSDPSSTVEDPLEDKYMDASAEDNTVTITKNYQLTNAGTVSPAETFSFTIERTRVSDAAAGVTKENMPCPKIGSVTYAKGEAGSVTSSKDITVTLPAYTSVGVYTYTIKEVIPALPTAGVTYRTEDITLVITVVEVKGKKVVAAVHCETPMDASNKVDNKDDVIIDGTKTDTFVNTYSAGNVEITKVVTGNLGDKTKYFDVTITLALDSSKDYSGVSITANGSALSWRDTDGTTTNPTTINVNNPTAIFHIKDGETVVISNIPYGVTYTVTETDYSDYTETIGRPVDVDADKDGITVAVNKIDSAKESVTVTNHKQGEVDTGINLDNMPYIVLLGIAAAGMILFLARKRVND